MLVVLFALIFEEVKTVIPFNKGKDQDWLFPSEVVILFDPKDEYKLQGTTHNDTSHALKHLADFKRSSVKGLLNKLKNFLLANNRKLVLKSKSGQQLDNKYLNQAIGDTNCLLVTLDAVNDKASNGQQLNKLEEYCSRINQAFADAYNGLINTVIDSKQNIDRYTIDDLINKLPKTIEFKINQQGLSKIYVYDFKTEGLLILRDNGDINTFFKLKRSDLKQYIRASGKPVNTNLLDTKI
jgi:hypothetical protein